MYRQRCYVEELCESSMSRHNLLVRRQKIMRRQKVVAQLGTLITLQCHVVHDSTGIHTSLINPTDGDRYVLLRFENLLVNPMNDCPR